MGMTFGFFPFSTSLDLSVDVGQMSRLISIPCSERTAASTRIFTYLKYDEFIILLMNNNYLYLYSNVYSSLDLSADLGQMWYLISSPCSE
jgi:hypothetical protein